MELFTAIENDWGMFWSLFKFCKHLLPLTLAWKCYVTATNFLIRHIKSLYKEGGDILQTIFRQSKCLQNLNNNQQISQSFSYAVNSPVPAVTAPVHPFDYKITQLGIVNSPQITVITTTIFGSPFPVTANLWRMAELTYTPLEEINKVRDKVLYLHDFSGFGGSSKPSVISISDLALFYCFHRSMQSFE